MEHSNKYQYEGFVVSFSTFRGMWEVLKKCYHHGAREASWRWFGTREQAESFCLKRIMRNGDGKARNT